MDTEVTKAKVRNQFFKLFGYISSTSLFFLVHFLHLYGTINACVSPDVRNVKVWLHCNYFKEIIIKALHQHYDMCSSVRMSHMEVGGTHQDTLVISRNVQGNGECVSFVLNRCVKQQCTYR